MRVSNLSAILKVADPVGLIRVGAGFRSANRSVAGSASAVLWCAGRGSQVRQPWHGPEETQVGLLGFGGRLRVRQQCRDPDMDNERLFVKRNAARWRLTLKDHGFVKAGTGDSADLSHTA